MICADKQRADIARWKGTDGHHGFLWRIPQGLAEKDGTRIEICDAETGRPLRGSPIRIEGGRTIALPRPDNVEAAVESRPGLEVRGWILDLDRPEHRRRVAIHVDGRLGAEIDADEQRADIARWKGTDGHHGFLWPIPQGLAKKDGTRIEISDADTGRPLRGSPIRIEDGRAIASGRHET